MCTCGGQKHPMTTTKTTTTSIVCISCLPTTRFVQFHDLVYVILMARNPHILKPQFLTLPQSRAYRQERICFHNVQNYNEATPIVDVDRQRLDLILFTYYSHLHCYQSIHFASLLWFVFTCVSHLLLLWGSYVGKQELSRPLNYKELQL